MACAGLAIAGISVFAASAAADTLEAQIEAGAEVYAAHCAECHGADGQGGSGYANPIIATRTLDRFGNGFNLWQYNAMMMPFQAPGSLDVELTWQVTAWLMDQNGWLDGLDEPLGPENARDIELGP
jgi:mono/diheme cytochrome c family protein